MYNLHYNDGLLDIDTCKKIKKEHVMDWISGNKILGIGWEPYPLSLRISNWIIKWINVSFINHGKQFNCNEKIFIDRSESAFSHCQFVNNKEIINFLENKGFTSYKLRYLSFQEQVYLFSNAKIIIGAHGAGFANLAFCKKDTKIIEIILALLLVLTGIFILIK